MSISRSQATYARLVVDRARRLSVPLCLMIAILGALSLTGCVSVRSSGSDAGPSHRGDAMPTPALSPSGSGSPSSLESSIAVLRAPGEDGEIRGSAVVIDSKGHLITAESALAGDVEVVLPDGQVHRPLVVAREPAAGLVLLKVPATRLVPVRFSTERISAGGEVIGTGYDSSSGEIGQIGGEVIEIHERNDVVEYRVRGPLFIDTDIPQVDSFAGGVLSNGDGGFAGMLIRGEAGDGRKTMNAVSNWFVLGWLDDRHQRSDALASEADQWETLSLPDSWSIAYPDGWSASIGDESDDGYRAEVLPGDPDATLQMGISVEPNQYGPDANAFVEQFTEEYAGATLWGTEYVAGRPLVRFSVAQEGARMDIAYLLDEDFLIAVSMTSGYDPVDEHDQSEHVRMLFDTVLGTLEP